jgi:Fe2+ transport system protein FeoA
VSLWLTVRLAADLSGGYAAIIQWARHKIETDSPVSHRLTAMGCAKGALISLPHQ